LHCCIRISFCLFDWRTISFLLLDFVMFIQFGIWFCFFPRSKFHRLRHDEDRVKNFLTHLLQVIKENIFSLVTIIFHIILRFHSNVSTFTVSLKKEEDGPGSFGSLSSSKKIENKILKDSYYQSVSVSLCILFITESRFNQSRIW
jgi:hypothetical protein